MIQIEGPVFLREGDNFYNQPPFTAIGMIAKGYDVDSSRLSTAVTFVVGKVALLRSPLREQVLTQYRDYSYNLFNKEDGDVRTQAKAFKEVVTLLEDFPEWHVYVKAKRDKGYYRKDGTYSLSLQSKSLINHPSYLAWLEQRVKTQEPFHKSMFIKVLHEDRSDQITRRTWRIEVQN